jgi:hypothetical protein
MSQLADSIEEKYGYPGSWAGCRLPGEMHEPTRGGWS